MTGEQVQNIRFFVLTVSCSSGAITDMWVEYVGTFTGPDLPSNSVTGLQWVFLEYGVNGNRPSIATMSLGGSNSPPIDEAVTQVPSRLLNRVCGL